MFCNSFPLLSFVDILLQKQLNPSNSFLEILFLREYLTYEYESISLALSLFVVLCYFNKTLTLVLLASFLPLLSLLNAVICHHL